jgi:hypothetical protein
MGQPTQTAGIVAETPAAIATNGFIGYSPDPDRTVYRLASSDKKGPVEAAVFSNARTKQYYR